MKRQVGRLTYILAKPAMAGVWISGEERNARCGNRAKTKPATQMSSGFHFKCCPDSVERTDEAAGA